MWIPNWLFLVLACCGVLVAITLLRAVVAGRGRRLLIVVALLCLPAVAAGFLWQRHPGQAAAIWTHRSFSREARIGAAEARRHAKHLQRDRRVAKELAVERYEEALQASRLAAEAAAHERDATVAMVGELSTPDAAEAPAAPAIVRARRALDAYSARLGRGNSHLPRGLVWNVVSAAAIGAFLFIGYLFLDAGTRGQFTWSLRILSLVAFSVLWAAMTMLRHTL